MDEKDLKTLTDSVKTATANVKNVVDKVDGFEKSLTGVTDELKELKSENSTKLKEFETALTEQSDAIKALRVIHEDEEPLVEAIKRNLASEDFKTARANQKDFEFKVKLLLPHYDGLPRSMTSHQVLPTIGQSHVPEYNLTALLTKGTLTSRTLYYIDEAEYDWTNTDRAVIDEAEAKPGVVPPTYEEHSVSLIKIADSMRVSSEVLWDIPFITSAINNTLLRDLQRQVEWSFIMGSGNANFKGLGAYAKAYTGTDLDGTVAKPTVIDAIIAMALQIELKGFVPDTVIMSPEMYTSITLMKDLHGNYIGNTLLGMLSRFNIVTSVRFSNKLAGVMDKGYVYVLDSSRYYAYNDGNITIRAGYNADDWITNQQTFVAEQRWLDMMYKRDEGSVLGGPAEDIITALTD